MSTEEIKFDCPECGEGLAIDRRAVGHQVACPFCKVPITVPEEKVPEKIPVEPISLGQGESGSATPSLEQLASSRPEPEPDHEVSLSGGPRAEPAVDAVLPDPNKEVQKGGLPPKRAPGEKPRAMAEGGSPGQANVTMPPPGRSAAPAPSPGAAPVRAGNPADQAHPAPSSGGASAVGSAENPIKASGVPEGFEQRVRRKRKRRNPDEHRLSPREHPTMVAFDDAVDDNSFRKHPGYGKMPMWKKLGVIGSIVGIVAAVALGILKQKQLDDPDEKPKPPELTPLEVEFEAVKKRLNEFREASSVAEKMSFVRIPSATLEGYPSLEERMAEFYNRNTLRAHFPRLDRASTAVVNAQGEKIAPGTEPVEGEPEFLRISVENKGVGSHAYFEKSAAGYALDWDSFVGYNPVSWTEFLINPTGETGARVFRLIFERAEHYTGRFQDQNRYRSYNVTDIASNMRAIAYVVRGTEAEGAIEAEFKKLKMRDEQRVLLIAPVVLDERGVDGAHLTYIEKVLRSSWLLP